MLGWLLTSDTELIGDIVIGGCWGCHDHAVIELTLLRDIRQRKSKTRKLDFRKGNFRIFRESAKKTLGICPQELRNGVELADLQGSFLCTQELFIPWCGMSGMKETPVWLNWELPVQLGSKKKTQRQREQGHVPQERRSI